MTVVMIAFAAALCFALISTPAVRSIAFRLGLISMPRSDRAHSEPTPLMGGVAIYIGATLALLLGGLGAQLFLRGWGNLGELAGILSGATLMAGVGLWDDRVRLGWGSKFLAQLVAVALPVLSGVSIQLPIPQTLNIALTVIWIVYLTNAVNFTDNMDGVAAATSTVAAAFLTLVAAMNGQYLVSSLAAAVMGASLGFLVFNLPLPRATIFMGDAGALFLGFLLAVLGIKVRFPENVRFVTWMVPLLILGVPLFDPVLVFVSRFRRRVPLMKGGVDHVSHRLARFGFGDLGTPLALALVAGGLGMTAVFVMQASLIEGYAMGASVFVLTCLALWQLEWRLPKEVRLGKLPSEQIEGIERSSDVQPGEAAPD
jgi:UDP-GlcNAc:undecaprenyl-phosphate GlcNAc-1-phosphate transferase